jgi:hypothetical protein
MLIYDRASGATAARMFRGDVRAVWQTVFGQTCVGFLKQQPYVFDQRNGWMIGVSFGLKERIDGKKITCRQIALVTDMGNGAVEVKVFAQLFSTRSYMVLDPNTRQYVAAMQSQPLHDEARTIGLCNAFLDAVEHKLAILH